jgi:hypothetical protein
VVLRVHYVSWRRHERVPSLALFSVLDTQRQGPFVLRREYLAPPKAEEEACN